MLYLPLPGWESSLACGCASSAFLLFSLPPPQFICESLSEPGKVYIGSWCISLDLQLIHSKLSSLYEGRKWFALLP